MQVRRNNGSLKYFFNVVIFSKYLNIFLRKFNSPVREYLVTVDPEETNPERAESVTCLAFEPTIPSKVTETIEWFQLRSWRCSRQLSYVMKHNNPLLGTLFAFCSAFMAHGWLQCTLIVTEKRGSFFEYLFLKTYQESSTTLCFLLMCTFKCSCLVA